jgi:hypothetical protein
MPVYNVSRYRPGPNATPQPGLIERAVIVSERGLPPETPGTLFFCDTAVAVRAAGLGRKDVAGEQLGWVLRDDAPAFAPPPPTWADLTRIP